MGIVLGDCFQFEIMMAMWQHMHIMASFTDARKMCVLGIEAFSVSVGDLPHWKTSVLFFVIYFVLLFF